MPGTTHAARIERAARAIRSTCAMTRPLEFFAAIAAARASSVSASRSIVMLPAVSAVVPRISATLIGNAL